MSNEVVIVALAQPAPGKLERFKEVTQTAMNWIEDNEPGTLGFEMYEEKGKGADEVRISLFERYASQAALEAHQNSEHYKRFFESVMAEELLVCAPQIVVGSQVCGFRR